ncbi:thiopurine S-methyltransferase [Dermacentor silvarum]|uniref:thiopurine S-methyltransferase n=1 Tax=Dermacentor silvarum TaxID=543639 RepID=UPI002100F5C3|nr:thiopurine S-methyltransferase [Dermacentor silvarum]
MAPVGAAVYGACERDGHDYWQSQWNEGGATWQQQGVTKLLKDNKDVVLAGKTQAQVFLPLCGKAHELKWFLDLGHSVVGVEFIEDVVREYFAENGLQLQEAICTVIGCKVLQTPDRRLRVFICSIFDFRRECAGLMDIVWDRSGFSAITEADRGRYSAVLKSLLAPGFSYGMWTICYDAPWYKLNPRSVTKAALLENYGDIAKPLLIDSYVVDREDFIDGAGPVTYSLWHMST